MKTSELIRQLASIVEKNGDIELSEVRIPPGHAGRGKLTILEDTEDFPPVQTLRLIWNWRPFADLTTSTEAELVKRERLEAELVEHRCSACFGDGQNEEMARSDAFGIPVHAMTNAEILEEIGDESDEEEIEF